MSRPLDPGALNEPVTSDDGMGGGVETLVERRHVWARFEPDAPAASRSDTLHDTLGAGIVTMRAGMAPKAGWVLHWTAAGISRTVRIDAVEPGRRYDRCRVKEVAR